MMLKIEMALLDTFKVELVQGRVGRVGHMEDHISSALKYPFHPPVNCAMLDLRAVFRSVRCLP